jgi:hypothetical protein
MTTDHVHAAPSARDDLFELGVLRSSVPTSPPPTTSIRSDELASPPSPAARAAVPNAALPFATLSGARGQVTVRLACECAKVIRCAVVQCRAYDVARID